MFPALVAQVEAFGNEVAGVQHAELQVPRATYAPWNLGTGYMSAPHKLTDLFGTYVPLPRTEAEKAQSGNARPSIVALYATREAYLRQAQAAAARPGGAEGPLAEDVVRMLHRAAAH